MPKKIETFGERLKRLIDGIGMTQAAFALDVGIEKGTISRYIKGKRQPEAGSLSQLATKLNVSMDYLWIGKGPASTSPHIIQFEHEDPKIISEATAEERLDSFIPVRILGDAVSMGPGMRVSDGATGGYAVIHEDALPKIARHQKRQNEKIVCLWAQGDSMNPTIQPGALVAVDLRANDVNEVEDRKIYVVWLPDGGVTIKRVIKRGGGLILIADNQDAEDFPMMLFGKDAERAIRGKVVWWWSKQE